jgi:hypothetical protein
MVNYDYSDLNRIKTKDFLEYMNLKNRKVEIPTAHYVLTNGVESEILSGDIPAPLIINEPGNPIMVKNTAIDQNTIIDSEIPIVKTITIMTDFFYNTNQAIRDSVNLKINLFLSVYNTKSDNVLTIIIDSAGDFAKKPFDWTIANSWWLGVLVIAIFIVSLAVANFRKSGGTTVNLGRRR